MTRGRRRELGLAALLALLLALDLVFAPPIPVPDRGTVVVARDGTPLRTYPGADGVWRQPVTPEEVSPLYLEALLHYEDRWFRWHPGVNPVALLRAAWQWLAHGRVVSGGSTLTMQVARILEPPPDGQTRTLRAKLRQILRAVQLELRLSKREILTLYLNRAPMGGIVEGVEMASRAYLGKSSRHLSHAEAALLAALPQAPSRLRPDRAPQRARAARDKVLDRLRAVGVWSARDVADARMEIVAVQPLRAQWIAPLAAERLRRQQGGRADQAEIASTLDVELQSTVERMLLDRTGALPPKVSMAVLVMHNDTLEVHAYAGSADFHDAQRAAHVDMVRGVRSPGSTLKPFLYALALDDGLVHSESLLVDAPQSFGGYQPGNFQASFSGPVSVAEALQRSLNVPAVDLLDRIGPARFAAVLRAGGLRLRMPAGSAPNLSLILGGAGTTLEELVGAYRAFARGGVAGRPRLTPDAPRVEAPLMSAGAAYIVRDILESGGHPDRPSSTARRHVAWKTGTSFGFRDAWAVGVTDEYTVGVWVGRPDGTPNPGFFGANVAAPLLHDIVDALPPVSPAAAATRRRPDSVRAVTICWPLGLRVEATDPAHCLVRRTGWALNGGVPPTLPDRARSGGLLVSLAGCGRSGHAVRWPTALEPWLRAPVPEGCDRSLDGGTALRIAGLEHGALLRPAPGRQHVDVHLSVLGTASAAQPVYWLVDGVQQRRASAREAVTLQFRSNGRHSITALDGQGRFHRIEVVVRGV
ncbi:penicillin-binding protein 1C [Caldimonas thermodepolymerans]|uniref:penicillin-binding protein 1C n=1 Tax=Caldimonas thermodepolymerans TaxID=215580 RepID=UPI000E2A7A43|nr:penicillin-binding protein 1C [Caldimonas thermodepolymerans]